MNNKVQSSTSATPLDQDSLRILRDVSHIYELAGKAQKSLAKAARGEGATYQAIGDALGVVRSRAHAIVNEDAA